MKTREEMEAILQLLVIVARGKEQRREPGCQVSAAFAAGFALAVESMFAEKTDAAAAEGDPPRPSVIS